MESLLHRKEQLVITAVDIINELGIQGLSTREIARRLGVSEATLFRHFKSKNELIAAVLDYFTQFDEDIIQTIKLKQLPPKEAIIFMVSSYAEYYENYPAITSIMQLFDVLRYETELTKKIKDIVSKRTALVMELIRDAQKAGEINPALDCTCITDIITGFIREICLNWRIGNYEFSFRKQIMDTLELVLSSLSMNGHEMLQN